MKVILFENVENVGLPGDIAEVKPGFFRNYLFPRGVAVEASPRNIKMLEVKRGRLVAEADKLRNASKSLGEQLQALTIRFTQKVGDNNRLFGSVTTADVAEKLAEQGFEVDKRRISLPGSVKSLGTFAARVKLQGNVNVPLTIIVEAENQPVEEPPPPPVNVEASKQVESSAQ